MAEILLFHQAQGLTPGVRHFAERLERAGHTVHVPDLYDGQTFDTLDEGLGYAQKVGFGAILERGPRDRRVDRRRRAVPLPAFLDRAG